MRFQRTCDRRKHFSSFLIKSDKSIPKQKKITTKNTKFIFDTIRPDYFDKKFEYVKIISNHHQTVHQSKRLICIGFK